MQFIKDGPDIPNDLIQAHEDGKVVFFCGAGISRPAGLPEFRELVDKIFKALNIDFEENEQEAYKKEQYDTVLYLLEKRVIGERSMVRNAVKSILTPKLRRKNALDMHLSLLTLAADMQDVLRLVTTNFDRLFEKAAKRKKHKHTVYQAPLLPLPKKSRWNGLVYLHGLLPSSPNDEALDNLVLSSSDFGNAYLNESWASRFVSELFKNYIICFVGYSINDPVMRYMMDAFVADGMRGEKKIRAYVFAENSFDKQSHWLDRGVVPIYYNNDQSKDHSMLRRTFVEWANMYRDGVDGKEAVVAKFASIPPSQSTAEDDYVGRVIWALSDPYGLPAKHFAELDPVPPLEWLFHFEKECFANADLPSFGLQDISEGGNKVKPSAIEKEELRFSLISRPCPHDKGPRLGLEQGNPTTQWDNRMRWLAEWTLRHLNNPRLILWIANNAPIHKEWKNLIEKKISLIYELEHNSDIAKLSELKEKSPDAIPNAKLRKLWRLVLSGRLRSKYDDIDIIGLLNVMKYEGLTSTLRLEFKAALAPRVKLFKGYRFYNENTDTSEDDGSDKMIHWELCLRTSDAVDLLKTSSEWENNLPELLFEFQQLLLDALSIQSELGGDISYDMSYLDLPSISDHDQNIGFRDWTELIVLLRDAWLALDDSKKAYIAEQWLALPYPTFKRLAFYAASQGFIDSNIWVTWLLSNNNKWLWGIHTKREVMQLLSLQGHSLGHAQARLEDAIIMGDSEDKFPQSERLEVERMIEHEIWLRLSKLRCSSGTLGKNAEAKLIELSEKHPKWELAKDDRDDFSFWMTSSWDSNKQDLFYFDKVPVKHQELVKWLIKPDTVRQPVEDNWREVCKKNMDLAADGLIDATKQNSWPAHRWNEAFYAWGDGISDNPDNEPLVVRSWRKVAHLLPIMPDECFLRCIRGIAWWLKVASSKNNIEDELFLKLINKVLQTDVGSDSGMKVNGLSADIERPVEAAINHPVGYITEALIQRWLQRNPNDGAGLPLDIKPILTKLSTEPFKRFKHARIILASRTLPLFRADAQWARNYLLPLFSWRSPYSETAAIWEGFLWAPRLYEPLFAELKDHFLQTAKHYEALKNHSSQYADLITYAALEKIDPITVEEFRAAFALMPSDGLRHAARTIIRVLESVKDRSDNYWQHRITPFWNEIWPKSSDKRSKELSAELARLAIIAGKRFPDAVCMFDDWLVPSESSQYSILNLAQSGHCKNFPEHALKFLDRLYNGSSYFRSQLQHCLKQIISSDPKLANDRRSRKLKQIVRQTQ